MPSSLYIGLMSGTSLDGVDAVLAHINNKGTKVRAHLHHPFSAKVRRQLERLCSPGHNEIYELGIAETQLTECYAAIVEALLAEAKISASQVAAIGCHGQTLRHHPELGFSLQANNPGALAARTGITVISDFRRADIALGGEGAPLVPRFHLHQFASKNHNKAVLNLGGIANISLLTENSLSLGFDTGPANTLLDAWCYQHTEKYYDNNGDWAASGNLLPTLLEKMLSDPYFALSPPKSTGREYFNLTWLESFLQGNELPADVQHTLAHLTLQSVLKAIPKHNVEELIICGGGAYNNFLINLFKEALAPDTRVSTSADYGLPPEQVEAAAFAWLAWAHINKVSGNSPQVTGASKELVLGGLYYG